MQRAPFSNESGGRRGINPQSLSTRPPSARGPQRPAPYSTTSGSSEAALSRISAASAT